VSRTMGGMYLRAFDTLLEAEEARRSIEQCRGDKATMRAVLPSTRVTAAPESIEKFMLRCESQVP
jgi:hypothetical protein